MSKSVVSIVRYEKPYESVKKAVELCGGFDAMPARAKVMIKPNLVMWLVEIAFPKWGVITTSRVIEDLVVLLKERGIDDISIGEGMVVKPKDIEVPANAFESLGYNKLKERYGVKPVNMWERPFEEVELAEDQTFKVNADILHSDFVLNVPVMKTHVQTATSLGIKNLKGILDIESRKKCHGPNLDQSVNYWIPRLPDPLPPMLTLIDGIYSNSLGPGIDGRLRRTDLLVASTDVLSADMVGTAVMGIDVAEAPYLVNAAKYRERPLDFSDIEVAGETIESVASRHEHQFAYNEDQTMPLAFEKMGIQGVSYYKYDETMCTYCASTTVAAITGIVQAWKGEPFDDVEVLTGKAMQPRGKKKTILLGKCMCDLHQDNPTIQEAILVKGCPPSPKLLIKGMHQAGIMVDPAIFESMEKSATMYMKRYEGKPEYDEAFFTVT